MIKKILFILTTSLAGFFLASACVYAQSTGEQITSFDAHYQIHADTSVDVQESIAYDFGDTQHHGIFRNIPYQYKERITIIDNIKVVDRNNQSYKYQISHENGEIVIKIGDADVLITGQHVYLISYRVRGIINYFDDHDEFYWNVTGNGWQVPILKSSANVILDSGSNYKVINQACYIGVIGSTEHCSQSTTSTGGQQAFFSQDNLASQEGLTIVVSTPKGYFAPEKNLMFALILAYLLENPGLIISILLFPAVLIFLLLKWRKSGRDPKGRATIIAEYEPPAELSPSQVGAIVNEKVENHEISAEIVELAVKGYLKINRIEKSGFFDSIDYELIKIKEADGGLNSIQQKLLKYLFADTKASIELTIDEIKKATANKIDLTWLKMQKKYNPSTEDIITKDSVKISDLKDKFAHNLKELKDEVFQGMTDAGYFAESPNKVIAKYITIGMGFIFIGFFLGGWFMLGGGLCGILFIIFSGLMPARTIKGVELRQHALGFKMYLSVAEKDRINFHNAPEKNPQLFEKFLPYAMALKVEKQWAEQFKDIYLEQPSWYNGQPGTFNSLIFVSQMNNFGAISTKSLASTPASSGSSGFGGGGFSGGGGGGGGGGSW